MTELWLVFPLNVDRGRDCEDPPQTSWDGKYSIETSFADAKCRARFDVFELRYDYVAIVEYVEGKGLELHSTFGWRPRRNDYDLVGTRADGYDLITKWAKAVLYRITQLQTQE